MKIRQLRRKLSEKHEKETTKRKEKTRMQKEEKQPISLRIKSVLYFILTRIAMHPDDVEVEVEPIGASSGRVSVRCHHADMSRIIGKQGAHVKAMTGLVSLMGAPHKLNMSVRVEEPAVPGPRDTYDSFRPVKDWPKADISRIMDQLADLCLALPHVLKVADRQDFQSVFLITCDPAERIETAQTFQRHAAVLFNAVGKKLGRHFIVDIDHPSIRNPLS